MDKCFSHFFSSQPAFWLRILFFVIVLQASNLWAQTCGAPGIDGPGAPTGVLNAYHAGSGSPASGVSSITVASGTGQRTNARQLKAGDLVIIMQMQDSSTPGNAGLYEYAQIASVSGTTIGLTRPLTNAYFQTMNTTNVRNWQVVYVPQYSSVNLTGTVSADRFTINTTTGAATGGVVALDVVGSMTLTGTITAAGAGFRGGAGLNGVGNRAGGAFNDANYAMTTTAANLNGSFKGEGIEGTPFQIFDGTATPVNYLALLGQGYAAGAGGQAARSNAGGGGNDGTPASSGNALNSGGGGGSNAGAGGRGGNSWSNNVAAGGLGGNVITTSATRIILGGGGGAGSANNAGASTITTWPPVTSTAANGATGELSGSGASGGGIIMVRAGSIAGTGVMDADGYNAYNRAPTSSSDSAGGGGAGGSIFATAQSGTGAGLTLRARGGWGGSSNYYDHGPGGGGGGGYVITNLTAATSNVSAGQGGTDGCCSGTQGNGSPKAYNSTAGNGAVANTAGGTALGITSGAACLPNLTVSKSTSNPLVSAAGATAVAYTISVSNSGGAAIGADLVDNALPPNWTISTTSSVTFAPLLSATTFGGFVESATPGSPAVANSPGTLANLSTNGTPAGSPTWANLSIPGINNGIPGRVTLNYVVNVPASATVGCYHNPAGVKYLDPTRITAGREITPLTNNSANRAGAQVGGTANTTYESNPGVTNVAGSNYSGLPDGSTAEDVCLQGDLSITKTATPTAVIAGNTVTFTLVVSSGRGIADINYTTHQANTVTNATTATAILPSGNLRVTDTLPNGVTVVNAFAGAGWSCTQTGQSLTCDRNTPVPVTASSVVGTITGAVRTTAGICGGSFINTATVVPLQSPYTETSVVNNTGTTGVISTTCSATLSVTKTNALSTVTAGTTSIYTVTYSNTGPSDASGAVVKDTASAGLASCTVTGCSATGGSPVTASCPASGNWPNIFTGSGLSLSNFPANSSIIFTLSCGVIATGL